MQQHPAVDPASKISASAGVPELAAHDKLRARTAAHHARTRYPGPVGDLLAREISAYVDFGYRTDEASVVPRLVDDLMRPQPAAS